jgi:phosphonate transport system permease protein
MSHSPTYRASIAFLLSAVVLLFFADLEVSTLDPWSELGRMAWGALTPNFLDVRTLSEALLMTVAFAFAGVALGAGVGFCLALVFHLRAVRVACAFVRAIHELFWALIFLQVLGLNPLTGLLAIAVPYAGTFGKVYAEILEEADHSPSKALPAGTPLLSAFLFARLPQTWAHLRGYSSYRFECGLRSSAVLGFVGLPTLGYHLESFFAQGAYSEVAALLLLFYLLIASLRLWVRPRLLWLYGLASAVLLYGPVTTSWANVHRFFTRDIVPAPLRQAELAAPGTWSGLGDWALELAANQALPGAVNTVVLTQIALVGTGIVTLLWFPLVSRHFLGRAGRTVGHLFLVVVRSTPEYILAYVFLQLWGPSMLPAIAALALHNGAIIGHLIGRHSNEIALRPDAPRGLNRYGYEVLPRVYPQFLAFLFYRWEVIMRETGILGILGIQTLGFYVDSAIAEIRIDRMMYLIGITALLNIAVDAFSRRLRAGLRLTTTAKVS